MAKFKDVFQGIGVFSGTFQCKVNFQGLFKTVLYIQVLFEPVRTLYYFKIEVAVQNLEL